MPATPKKEGPFKPIALLQSMMGMASFAVPRDQFTRTSVMPAAGPGLDDLAPRIVSPWVGGDRAGVLILGGRRPVRDDHPHGRDARAHGSSLRLPWRVRL